MLDQGPRTPNQPNRPHPEGQYPIEGCQASTGPASAKVAIKGHLEHLRGVGISGTAGGGEQN